jgi:hypothetical protein
MKPNLTWVACAPLSATKKVVWVATTAMTAIPRIESISG